MPREDTFYDRVLRRRREEGDDWSEQDELKWLRRHPEDAPPGWVDPDSDDFPVEAEVVHDADLIPDVEVNEQYEDVLAPYLDPISVLDAYQRWSGKSLDNSKQNRGTEIQVSCPIPGHVDKNPSCSVNTEKDTWYCYTCCVGGDKYDIYALNRGWADYKPEFHKLRRAMAEELGYVEPEPSVSLPEEEPMPALPVAATGNTEPAVESEPVAPVVPLAVVRYDEGEDHNADITADPSFRIEWETIIPPETFLSEWLYSTAAQDDLPHEYYFWLGLQALGFAAGHDVQLLDKPAVKPNLYIITYGKSGSGKSRSSFVQAQLLERALPFDGDEFTASRGVKMIPTPGSAEALIKSFSHPIHDPSDMKILEYATVRGLISIDEFAAFVARTARHGSALKQTIITCFDVNGGTVTNSSIGGGTITAYNPFVQMLSTTQPKAIHEFASRSDVESGFLNRFVFAVGTRRIERRSYGGAAFDIDGAVHMLQAVHAWALTGHMMSFTPGTDAAKKWDQVFRRDLMPLIEHPEETMWTRLDLLCKKLILLFCVNEKQSAPTADIIERVASLLPYLARSQGMFSQDLNYNQFDECMTAVRTAVEAIIKKQPDKPVTNRLIHQRLYRKYPSEMIVRAIKTSGELGILKMTSKSNKRGPATEGYMLP